MISARQENARTLAAAIGSTEDQAAVLLDAVVLLTVAPGKEHLGQCVSRLLERTLANIVIEPDPSLNPALEVLIGDVAARSSAPIISVATSGQRFVVRDGIPTPAGSPVASSPIVDLLAACYAAAAAAQRATRAELPIPVRLPIEVDLGDLLGADAERLRGPTDLGELFMAGAGAIGNGVLLGFSALNVRGELHLCDPDTVSAGNMNRCVWFTTEDIGKFKAERLAHQAHGNMPHLQLIPHACVLRDAPAAKSGGPWLDKLVVTVDSRRARRALQNEMPHHVFDASTTGISEIVLHFNRLPNSHACLSCVYHEAADELAHERHVADSLGVSVADVTDNFVTQAAARAIALKYPELLQESLVGLAYDSLFKQLCGQGALKTAADQQVLAPFSFVSVLAGVLLAIEIVRRVRGTSVELTFNYWRVSPWSAPLLRARESRLKRTPCEFCDNPVLQTVVRELWGSHG